MSDVTQILKAIEPADGNAIEQLLPIVHGELRQLARQQMSRERLGHTLQATALVHEAYMRLVHGPDPGWPCRPYFFVVEHNSAVSTGSRIISNQVSSSDTVQGGWIGSENSNLSLSNCQINANLADGATAQGGGIFALASTVSENRCTVSGNRANGAVSGEGGGIYAYQGDLNLVRSIIQGNTASTGHNDIFVSP